MANPSIAPVPLLFGVGLYQFQPQNLLSTDAVVTGTVIIILSRIETFGYTSLSFH
jgi:hypothetical protein